MFLSLLFLNIFGKKVGQVLYEYEQLDEEEGDSGEAETSSAEKQFEAVSDSQKPQANATEPKDNSSENKKKLMVPAVRALVREHNISLDDLVGTGKDGRITKEDVLAFLKSVDEGTQVKRRPGPRFVETITYDDPRAVLPKKIIPSPPTLNELTKINPNRDSKTMSNIQFESTESPKTRKVAQESPKEVQKMTNFEKGMQKTMTQASSIPQFFFHDEYDFTSLVKSPFRLFNMN